MKEKNIVGRLSIWVLILYTTFFISYSVIKIIISYDKDKRDSVFSYCADYVRDEFIEEYGKFDLIVCGGQITYIQELNEDNVKSAGYKIYVEYQVDNIWHKENYAIRISWKERNFLDRRTDFLREKQIVDYEIVKLT